MFNVFDDPMSRQSGMVESAGRDARNTGLSRATPTIGRNFGLGWLMATPRPVSGYSGTLAELNPNSENYASEGLARLTRERFADFRRRFRGIEDQQIAFATDRNAPMAAATEAIGDVQSSFGQIAGQQARRNARTGLDAMPADVQASQARTTNLAGGLAAVTAANRAARQTYDRQSAVFGGAGAAIPRMPT